MERSIKTCGVVTGTRKYGEINKMVTLLSPDLGPIDAVIYGGRKGRKAGMAVLFSAGNYELYYNPVKKEYSLVEEQCTFLPSNIPEDLKATYTASYFCELVTKARSDSWAQTYTLLSKSLMILDASVLSADRLITVFSFKLMQQEGAVPDLETCPFCGHVYADDEPLSFSSSECSPACRSCSDQESPMMGPGSRRYFRYIAPMDVAQAVAVEINDATEARLKNYMLAWITAWVGFRLSTIASGML